MTYLRGALALLGFALLILVSIPLQRLAIRLNLRLQHRLPLLFCRTTCRLLGVRPRFHGGLAGPSPRMIVPNHVSWTDVLVLGCRQAPLRFVAKSEVAGWPLLGAIARLTGTIFVERRRRRSILRVNAALADRLRAGEDIVIFAEATTGDGTRVERFNAPLFAAARDFLRACPDVPHVELAPVGITYSRRYGLPLGRLGRAQVAWYGDTELLPHLWDLVTRRGLDCDVAYGAAIRFEPTSDRKAVARLAEAAVRRLVSRRLAGRLVEADPLPVGGPLAPELKPA